MPKQPSFGSLSMPGPYAPMGHGINIGTPLDMSRPMLDNPDGSFSTERTITLEKDGKFYNVPTIVRGVEMPEQFIQGAFLQGLLPHVGEFGSLEQALRSAHVRSKYIGNKRGAKR